jgi:nicotinamidase-related amidase
MNPTKILFGIDLQNDFIDGALGSKDAQAIVNKAIEVIKNFDGHKFFTLDTHYADYLDDTLEGKKLPVPHCIRDTVGWKLNPKIWELVKDLKEINGDMNFVYKNTFGYTGWKSVIMTYFERKNLVYNPVEFEFTIIGLCTDICVIANALILRAIYPNVPIKIIANACAGTSKEAHEAALLVAKQNQIDVVY